MNLATVRRTIGLAAAVGVATLASVLLPGTAHAHEPTVTGAAECDVETGNWIVTWKVTNSEADLAGTLTEVSVIPADAPLPGIAVGDALPTAPDALTAKQTLPGSATSASLSVTATWQRPTFTVTESASASVELGGSCEKPREEPREPKPSATFTSTCDATVKVDLVNAEEATAPATFQVTSRDGFLQSVKVGPGEEKSVTVPPGQGERIAVTAGDKVIATGAFEEPESCGPQLPKTGASLPGLVSGGVALVMVGIAILFNVRKRPPVRG